MSSALRVSLNAPQQVSSLPSLPPQISSLGIGSAGSRLSMPAEESRPCWFFSMIDSFFSYLSKCLKKMCCCCRREDPVRIAPRAREPAVRVISAIQYQDGINTCFRQLQEIRLNIMNLMIDLHRRNRDFPGIDRLPQLLDAPQDVMLRDPSDRFTNRIGDACKFAILYELDKTENFIENIINALEGSPFCAFAMRDLNEEESDTPVDEQDGIGYHRDILMEMDTLQSFIYELSNRIRERCNLPPIPEPQGFPVPEIPDLFSYPAASPSNGLAEAAILSQLNRQVPPYQEELARVHHQELQNAFNQLNSQIVQLTQALRIQGAH